LEDTKKKIENLVKILKEKDPEELQEQVYVDYEFVLCKRCRDTFARRLALREFI
jgi:hypothetical protein